MSPESRARRAPGALAGVGEGWRTRFLSEARDLPREETKARRGKACALPLPPTALQVAPLTLIPTYPGPLPAAPCPPLSVSFQPLRGLRPALCFLPTPRSSQWGLTAPRGGCEEGGQAALGVSGAQGASQLLSVCRGKTSKQ